MDELSDAQLELLERTLREKLAEAEAFLATKGEEQVVELDQARMGRISRMDAIVRQEIALKQRERTKQLRKELRAALFRLAHEPEEFGICLECDEAIPIGRLLIKPAAEYCVRCQEAQD